MSTEPEPDGTIEAPAFVEDLFLTDAFLVKGRLSRKYQRLTQMLEDHERTFLAVEDATMISLRGGEVIRTPSVLIHRDELILAHELVEMAGDTTLKRMAANEKSTQIRAFYNGAVQIELSGKIEPLAYESAQVGQSRRFFIMTAPVIRGLNVEGSAELRCLKGLSYAIVQKDRLAYIYDFSCA